MPMAYHGLPKLSRGAVNRYLAELTRSSRLPPEGHRYFASAPGTDGHGSGIPDLAHVPRKTSISMVKRASDISAGSTRSWRTTPAPRGSGFSPNRAPGRISMYPGRGPPNG